MAEVTFTVSQIHCGGCEARIETGLSRLAGVRRVSADQATQTVTIRYNEQAVEEDALAEQLEKTGYTVESRH